MLNLYLLFLVLSLITNDKSRHLGGMEIGSGAGGPNDHRLVLLSECDSALGGLPLHVDILCLHEGLFFVDISRLDFIIERTGSVLAGNSGK